MTNLEMRVHNMELVFHSTMNYIIGLLPPDDQKHAMITLIQHIEKMEELDPDMLSAFLPLEDET